MSLDPGQPVTDHEDRPLVTGARVTGWRDGIPYTGAVTRISRAYPGCGYRHIIVTRDEDQAEMETFSNAVVQPGSRQFYQES